MKWCVEGYEYYLPNSTRPARAEHHTAQHVSLKRSNSPCSHNFNRKTSPSEFAWLIRRMNTACKLCHAMLQLLSAQTSQCKTDTEKRGTETNIPEHSSLSRSLFFSYPLHSFSISIFFHRVIFLLPSLPWMKSKYEDYSVCVCAGDRLLCE